MKKFTLLFCFIIFCKVLFAIPAFPKPITLSQPDGNTLTVSIKGDERIHWYESLDGYTLLFNQNGYLTYAQLDEDGNLQSSDFIATNISDRSMAIDNFLNTIAKKLFYSDVQKQLMLKIWEIEDETSGQDGLRGDKGVTGQYKTLCAFVQFPNKSFIKTISQFEGLMNQLGYTANGTGSVRDFFKESSYNQFDLIITLCGIYTAPQNESYYAGSGGTQNCQELARWTAQQVAAESSINFADYDSNNDGVVDGFHFIFAGLGQEGSGSPSLIWSHKWQFSPAVTKNGKSISIYSCSPELISGSTITTIGVICHEMTHAFGAPDFYDTDYETGGSYTGTGTWDIMAEGSWNGSPGGNCPPHHNMYTKVQFGWVTPVTLSSPITILNMPNSAENPVAYRINTTTSNEYYLLDNRQRVKFDVSVPGDGLLIYHVHSNVGSSGVNATHPQRLYPVCASRNTQMPTATPSSYGNINTAGCPFPGTSNKTSFTDNSTPAMKSWANANTEKPITNITHSTRLISFDFMGGEVSNCDPVTNLAATLTADCIANLTWNAPALNPGATYNVYRDLELVASNVATTSYSDADFLVTAGHTWSVKVACTGTGESYAATVTKLACKQQHTITANAGSNGTITPSGSVQVIHGEDQSFNFSPNSGYEIYQVLVNGENNPEAITNKSYTFTNVTTNHSISVTFKAIFIAVTDIINLPLEATVGTPLTLTGTVVPSDATNKTITWSVVSAGTTGATISGKTFKATAGGIATVRATIINGLAVGSNFKKEFDINVTADYVPVTNITNLPSEATVGSPLTLTGTVVPDNATNQTITWSLIDAGTTEATITGDIFNATAVGDAIVMATIVNGLATGDYTQEFKIKASGIGVTEFTQKFDYIVFPNPTTGELRVESGKLKVESIEIYDIYGRKQEAESRRQQAEGEVVINISNLAAGIYFLKIDEQMMKVIKN